MSSTKAKSTNTPVDLEEHTSEDVKKAKSALSKILNKIFAPLRAFLPDKHLNQLLSILDPFLGDSARAAAAKLRRNLGDPDWLRNPLVGSILGPLSATIEEEAIKLDEPAKSIIQKTSDWFDEFASALRGDDDHQGNSKKGVQDVFTKVKAKRLEELHERLAKATPADAPVLRQQMIDDTKALAELEELMLKGIEKPMPEKAPGVPLSDQVGEVLGKINDSIERNLRPAVDTLKQSYDRRKRTLEDQKLDEKLQASLRAVNGEPFLRKVRRFIFGI